MHNDIFVSLQSVIDMWQIKMHLASLWVFVKTTEQSYPPMCALWQQLTWRRIAVSGLYHFIDVFDCPDKDYNSCDEYSLYSTVSWNVFSFKLDLVRLEIAFFCLVILTIKACVFKISHCILGHVSSSSILHKIQIYVMLNWVNVHGCYYWIPTLTPYIHFYIRSNTGMFATKSDITRMDLAEAQVEIHTTHTNWNSCSSVSAITGILNLYLR